MKGEIMERIDFETALVEVAKLPMVKIDRELFLRKELRNHYSKEVVDLAILHSPAFAGIKTTDIDRIAKNCIIAETRRVTIISAATGIPGGLAMIGTMSVDIMQYLGHLLRILQELIYLYGWQDLNLNESELDEETKNILTLFIGVMFGISGAVKTINGIADLAAKQMAKRLPRKALTKGTIYPIIKKISQMIGAKMTKEIFANGVSKAVPVVGAVVSGSITFVSFKPMAERLRRYLASCKMADTSYYEMSRNEEFIDVDIDTITNDIDDKESK